MIGDGLSHHQLGYTMGTIAAMAWRLHVNCPACKRETSFTCAELAARYPAGVTVHDILERMVCSTPGCAGCDGDAGPHAMFMQDNSAQHLRDMARIAREAAEREG